MFCSRPSEHFNCVRTKKKKFESVNVKYHKGAESVPGTRAALSFSGTNRPDVCHKAGPLARCPVRSQHLFGVIAGR